MKKYGLIAIALLSLSLFAFRESEKEVSIRLTVQEAELVLTALNEAPLPASKTQPVARKIIAQAQAQITDTANIKKK